MLLFLYFFIYIFSFSLHAETMTTKINHLLFGSTYEENISTTLFPPIRKSESQNIFIFSPKEHTWALYNKNGKRVGLGRAVGGKDYCEDIHQNCRTVEGKYRVFKKDNKDCSSKTFPIDEGGGAPMPYCIFFYKGYAIHGSDHLGTENISHGCVRVAKAAAKWLNENYLQEGSYVQILPY